MPVAHFHLPAATFAAEAVRGLLTRTSWTYARVLECPIERVRVYLVEYTPEQVAVAGVVATESTPAPYFTAIVMSGRSAAQRQRLLSGFTDDIVDVLGCDRALVRGQIIEVHPENWAIGGASASQTRTAEIASRTTPVSLAPDPSP